MIKPLRSHEYQAKFPGKFRTARSADELIARFREMGDAGIECMLVEMIEGPDSLLCSYFTYIDETGKPAFHFTKRIIRRNPPMQGNGVYHITAGPTADPEIKDLALKFITAAQIRGLANTEFKRDPRDGALKLIECNVRFVASNVLLAAAGVDLPALVYKHIVGEPVSWPITYRDGLRLWHPVDDLRAFVALRRRGELTFPAYVRSVAHRQTFPIMHWDDPLPAVARAAGRIRRVLSGQPHSPA